MFIELEFVFIDTLIVTLVGTGGGGRGEGIGVPVKIKLTLSINGVNFVKYINVIAAFTTLPFMHI